MIGNVENSDFPPTEQHRAVAEELGAEVDAAMAEYEALAEGALAEFNGRLRTVGLDGLVTGG